MTIKDIIRKWRENAMRKKERDLFFRASELYQIREFDGCLWVTYDGKLICPLGMFSEDGITVITKMRTMYLSRNGMNV